MFRSRRTYEEYINSLENEEQAPLGDLLNDEEIVEVDVDAEVEGDELHLHFNPSLVPIPEGFKDDQEVLVIGIRLP
jgi:hypothetical protein